MKKILFLMLLVSAILGLSATAGHALEPGCSPDFMPLLQHQADAIRARSRAYEREIINREESTLYLTCFDQAMALSARLGYIFSDNVPADPPPANTFVFTQALAFPDWGAQHMLAVDLNNVITPMLDNEMLNFLPPWVTPNQLTVLVNQLQPIIDQIKSFQDGQKGTLDQYIALVRQIDKLVAGFATATSSDLPGQEDKYKELIKQMQDLIKTIKDDRKSNLESLLKQLRDDVFAAKYDCTHMDDLWNKYDAASEFYPPEGDYYAMTPYYNLQEFLGGNPPGATPVFLYELATATDSPLLSTALNDLTSLLNAPGQLSTWPASPTLPATATTRDIINQM